MGVPKAEFASEVMMNTAHMTQSPHSPPLPQNSHPIPKKSHPYSLPSLMSHVHPFLILSPAQHQEDPLKNTIVQVRTLVVENENELEIDGYEDEDRGLGDEDGRLRGRRLIVGDSRNPMMAKRAFRSVISYSLCLEAFKNTRGRYKRFQETTGRYVLHHSRAWSKTKRVI